MRKLNVSDLTKVVKILGKVGTNLNLSQEMSNAEIGLNFISTAAQYADEDLTSLLASIAEMPVEEFKKMPIDYPLEVIEELAETEDLKTFFTRAKALTGKLFKK